MTPVTHLKGNTVNNVINYIKANRAAITKKVIIIAGTAIGLIVASELLLKDPNGEVLDAEVVETEDAE